MVQVHSSVEKVVWSPTVSTGRQFLRLGLKPLYSWGMGVVKKETMREREEEVV